MTTFLCCYCCWISLGVNRFLLSRFTHWLSIWKAFIQTSFFNESIMFIIYVYFLFEDKLFDFFFSHFALFCLLLNALRTMTWILFHIYIYGPACALAIMKSEQIERQCVRMTSALTRTPHMWSTVTKHDIPWKWSKLNDNAINRKSEGESKR